MAKPISLQLYTLREAAAKDFPRVLRTVAGIGYKGVEFAGLHDHDPGEIKKLIDDLGLQVSSSHTGFPEPKNFAKVAETEMALGNKNAISGFGADRFKTLEETIQAAEKFQKAAGLIGPLGIRFGIHNHWWEFDTVDGKLVFDVIMEQAPAIFSELDVYWCAYGKADPIKIIEKYKERMPLLHIKDGMLEDKTPHKAVGDGVLDIPAIIGAADPNVLEWLVVELDEYDGDMFEAVRRSYDYLTSNGLAEGNK